MTVFATLSDLADIGAVPVNEDPGSLRAQRAYGLLAKASAQALLYLGLDDTAAAALSDNQKLVLATVIAEAASSRLQYDTAPSTDSYGAPQYMSSMLNRWHMRVLDELLSGTAGVGSVSLVVTRDDSSTFLPPYPLNTWPF